MSSAVSNQVAQCESAANQVAQSNQAARSNAEEYERYLRNMDAAMKQKIAFTAAHLLCDGNVADMGMGSGAGSYALAALYPALQVVGVDLDPEMVELATKKHTLANLSFKQGDIAEEVFERGSMDGIFNSSVLHHVTSFGGYKYENAARALRNQALSLAPHGVLVIRDFVAPPSDPEVLLELPTSDGNNDEDAAFKDPKRASTARLFERYAKEHRSLHTSPGFRFEVAVASSRTWIYKVSLRCATEFLLRKDYRDDWVSEAREEYTYFTQDEFEAHFAALSLRILASTPIRNPWILRNRWVGKVALRSLSGAPLEWPSTNIVIAGEKVSENEGVTFVSQPSREVRYLERAYYRHKTTRQVFDLVRRPNVSIDVLPYFESGKNLYLLARMSYPRPIVGTPTRTLSIDESSPSLYVTEPLNVGQTDKPLGQTVDEMLSSKLGLESAIAYTEGTRLYPSPGGSQEEVRSVFVQIEPVFVLPAIENTSGFSSSGRVRAIEGEQILRAAQVGGLPDARLELNTYDLFLKTGRAIGAWIGESISLRENTQDPSEVASWTQLLRRPKRRMFERAGEGESTGFLALEARLFEEKNAEGKTLYSRSLEYVVPTKRSSNTVATALLWRTKNETYLGVSEDDLPAAQCFSGNSNMLVTPAWRLPVDVANMMAARQWVRDRIHAEYKLETGEMFELGGRYHPSSGMSPEVVFPLAIEILGEKAPPGQSLFWIPLSQAASYASEIHDGHLRTVTLRAAHALGFLAGKTSQ